MPQSQPQYISYSPTDYFYMQAPLDTTNTAAATNLTNINKSDIGASTFDNTETNLVQTNVLGNGNYTPEDIEKICENTGSNKYNAALCDNYNLAQQLEIIQNSSLSSGVMYNETKSMYSRELLMTVNICAGIVGASIFIYLTAFGQSSVPTLVK